MKPGRADYLEAARAARALAEHTIRGAETELDGALKTACAALEKLPREPMDELLLGLLGPFALAVLAETLEEVAAKRCRKCGCTDLDACLDPTDKRPCSWVEDDLCSACAGTREVRHA